MKKTADLVTFTEEILDRKLHSSRSDSEVKTQVMKDKATTECLRRARKLGKSE